MKNFFYLFTLIFSLALMASSCKKSTTTTMSSMGPRNINSCIIGKWSDSAIPLSLKMSSEFSSDFAAEDLVNGLNPLEAAAKEWNDVTLPTKTLISTPFNIAGTTGTSSTSAFRDGEIGIYKSHTWFDNVSPEALAITQFYGVVSSSPEIGPYIALNHADIIVNYRDYGSRLTMIDNPIFEYDLPTVILHEMGHLLGLCHETLRPSVMMPRYITTQRSLQTFDKNIIKSLYLGQGPISGMSAQKKAISGSLDAPSNLPPMGTEVKGIVELRSNGDCLHYLEGKEVYRHKMELKK